MRVRRLPPRRAAAQIKQLMRSALVLMYACLGRVAGLTARATVRRRPHVLRAVATRAPAGGRLTVSALPRRIADSVSSAATYRLRHGSGQGHGFVA